MKIVRFLDLEGQIRFGLPTVPGKARLLAHHPLESLDLLDREITLGKLLAPLTPSAILCVGLNYRKHAEETGAKIPEHPILFMKSPTAVQHPGDPILLPRHLQSNEVDYEAELAVVIGRTCKNATRANALDHVLGYTCANDVSARDWQKHGGGGQWCRGKGFDTFCPLGPWIVTRDEIPNPNQLRLQTRVNGETLQDSNTADMIFDVPALIEFLSGSTTLAPGTVILTGTPSGVGMAREPKRWLLPKDRVEIEIEQIGVLENPVAEEPV
ncbi:MAG: fumarylacetoacetate hydrolase family protein [Candidatus Methylacidiphilales bacterium]|nr:fumarylacetoacetate hydrolase family protein [Candidatus Methylacidiphilales bacterium]